MFNDNPHYNISALFNFDTNMSYSELFDYIRSGNDALDFYMWHYWPILCSKVSLGLTSQFEFMTLMVSREIALGSILMSGE